MEHEWRFDFDNGSLPCATPYMVLDDDNSNSNDHSRTLPQTSSVRSFDSFSDLDNPDPSSVDDLIADVTDDKSPLAHPQSQIERCTPNRFQLKLPSSLALSQNPEACMSSTVSQLDCPPPKKRTCSTLECFGEHSPPVQSPRGEELSAIPQPAWQLKRCCDGPIQENSCSEDKTNLYDASEPSNTFTNDCSTSDSQWKKSQPSLLGDEAETSGLSEAPHLDLIGEASTPFGPDYDVSSIPFKFTEDEKGDDKLVPNQSVAQAEGNVPAEACAPLTEKEALLDSTYSTAFVTREAVDSLFDKNGFVSGELTLPACNMRAALPEDDGAKLVDVLVAEKSFPGTLTCDALKDSFPDCAGDISPQELNLVMDTTTDSCGLLDGLPGGLAGGAVSGLGVADGGAEEEEEGLAGAGVCADGAAGAKVGGRKKRKKTTKREAAKAASAAERRRTEEIVRLAKEKLISDEEILKLKPKKVRRAARFEQAIPSRFCHICSRTPKSATLVACRRLAVGTCRKVACDKCFAEYGLGDFEAARDLQTSRWECTHCSGTCPDRAQCTTYQRINDRLRANRLKQDRPKGRKGRRQGKKGWEEDGLRLEVASPIESENVGFGFAEEFAAGGEWEVRAGLEF